MKRWVESVALQCQNQIGASLNQNKSNTATFTTHLQHTCNTAATVKEEVALVFSLRVEPKQAALRVSLSCCSGGRSNFGGGGKIPRKYSVNLFSESEQQAGQWPAVKEVIVPQNPFPFPPFSFS